MIQKIQIIIHTRAVNPKVLLLRRPPGRGHIWQPVTGKVDAEDLDLEVAARREMHEETGLENILSIQNTGHTFRFKKGTSDVVEHVFGIAVERTFPVRLSHEHVDYAWLTPDDALERLTWEINREGLRRVLELSRSEAQSGESGAR